MRMDQAGTWGLPPTHRGAPCDYQKQFVKAISGIKCTQKSPPYPNPLPVGEGVKGYVCVWKSPNVLRVSEAPLMNATYDC